MSVVQGPGSDFCSGLNLQDIRGRPLEVRAEVPDSYPLVFLPLYDRVTCTRAFQHCPLVHGGLLFPRCVLQAAQDSSHLLLLLLSGRICDPLLLSKEAHTMHTIGGVLPLVFVFAARPSY